MVVESRGRLRNRKIFALGGELLDVLPVRVDVYDILEIANPSAMYENIQKEGVVIYDSSGTEALPLLLMELQKIHEDYQT